MENVENNFNPVLSFHPVLKISRKGDGEFKDTYSETYSVSFALTEHLPKMAEWVTLTRSHNDSHQTLYDGKFVAEWEGAEEGEGWESHPGGLEAAITWYKVHYKEKYSGSTYKMKIRFVGGSTKEIDLEMGPIQIL